MGKTASKREPSKAGEPVWELLRRYPLQGDWTEDGYLSLDEGRLIEYTDGVLEFPSMPTTSHQIIVQMLIELLMAHLKGTDALVLSCPLPVKIRDGKYCEPDVLCALDKNDPRVRDRFWIGADLLMEVVSKGTEARTRDYDDKPKFYAEAGVTEYWIVDPHQRRITVLSLRDGTYVEHSVVKDHGVANSTLLDGFTVSTEQVFDLN